MACEGADSDLQQQGARVRATFCRFSLGPLFLRLQNIFQSSWESQALFYASLSFSLARLGLNEDSRSFFLRVFFSNIKLVLRCHGPGASSSASQAARTHDWESPTYYPRRTWYGWILTLHFSFFGFENLTQGGVSYLSNERGFSGDSSLQSISLN